MDLRGFSPGNKGCIFEIGELLNVIHLDRVVFVVDRTTNDAFLREVFAEAGASLAADSPNRGSTLSLASNLFGLEELARVAY